jgi:hypothetical protein
MPREVYPSPRHIYNLSGHISMTNILRIYTCNNKCPINIYIRLIRAFASYIRRRTDSVGRLCRGYPEAFALEIFINKCPINISRAKASGYPRHNLPTESVLRRIYDANESDIRLIRAFASYIRRRTDSVGRLCRGYPEAFALEPYIGL